MSENKRNSLTNFGGLLARPQALPKKFRTHQWNETSVAREVRYQRKHGSENMTEIFMRVDQSIADPQGLTWLAFAPSYQRFEDRYSYYPISISETYTRALWTVSREI